MEINAAKSQLIGQGVRLLCALGRVKQFSVPYSEGQVKVR